MKTIQTAQKMNWVPESKINREIRVRTIEGLHEPGEIYYGYKGDNPADYSHIIAKRCGVWGWFTAWWDGLSGQSYHNLDFNSLENAQKFIEERE